MTNSSTRRDEAIGYRIRQLRQARRLSQSDLAERIGVTYQQVQKYERGRTSITAVRLIDIAGILGEEPRTLLAAAEEPVDDIARRARIDRQAAHLWHRLQEERYKKALLDLMTFLQPRKPSAAATERSTCAP